MKVRKVIPGHKEREVLSVHEAFKGRRVRGGQKALKAQKERKALKVLKALKALEVAAI